jgi:hypothetical protein
MQLLLFMRLKTSLDIALVSARVARNIFPKLGGIISYTPRIAAAVSRLFDAVVRRTYARIWRTVTQHS